MRPLRMMLTLPVLCLAMAAAMCLPVAAQTMKVHFIDVGQGAATLIEFPCAAILVDTGGESNAQFRSSTELIEYLDEFFSGRPDLNQTLHSLVLSHPHIDHTRGVKAVLARYRVLNAVTNGQEQGSGMAGQKALHKKVQDSEESIDESGVVGLAVIWQKNIPAGTGLTNAVIDPVRCETIDPVITALWGQVDGRLKWPAKELDNENNHSVALRIDFGKSSILLSGDMEEAAIQAFVALHKGSPILDVDVIQVNHHGSHNGTTLALLKATTPKYAVIGMGNEERQLPWTAWKYGHPRKPVVDLLSAHVSASRPRINVTVATGAKTFQTIAVTKAVYGTGWDGTVVLEADTEGNWLSYDRASARNLINLNTASVEELIKLPLIGHARANAIIEYRNTHGPIRKVDDLLNIRGIKAGTIGAISSLVKL